MDLRRSLGRFIDGCAHGRRILVGHSLGGALAMFQAAIEPGSVDGVVLNGSVFPIPASGGTAERLLLLARRNALPAPAVLAGFALYDSPWLGERMVGIRTSRLDPELVVRLSLRFLTADPAAVPDDVVRATAELLRHHDAEPEAGAAFLVACRSLLRFLRRDDLGEGVVRAIKAPTLVIHGRVDRLVPVSWAGAALDRRPDWRGRLLPGVGHIPQMEVPDRWVREVADWIPTALEG
jgi:pimeloyl-ACP methyl ester carboxylesterase